MNERGYTTNVGDYLIVCITGCMGKNVAEVVQSDPLQLKIEETGPYSCLKDGDFIVREADSEQFQKDCLFKINLFVKYECLKGRKVFSGLKSLYISEEGSVRIGGHELWALPFKIFRP